MTTTADPVTSLPPGVHHFLDLARQGARNPGCSSGERQAWKIAQSLIKNCPGLDDSAISGISEAARMAAYLPNRLRASLTGK